jgi:hypothetical protein
MKRLALALVLAAFSASAARAIGPEIGPYRPIGGVGGSITTIINSDGNLDIADPSGPSADITLGANVVVKNASNTFGIATTQNFQATTFMPPASSVCAPGAGQLCFDTNGTTGLGGALGVYGVGGTDYFMPSLTAAQIGTAGTKRAIGIGAGNAAEVTPLTTTPTANAIPLADGSGKIDGGWLSALVSLLGQTIEIAEIAAGDKSGNGTDLATTTGTLTPGDCVEIDANGNFIESGDPCGTGGGSSLLAQASAPANPGAGTFTFWFDTIAEQIKAVLSDGTIHSLLRRQNGSIPTGSLLAFDGVQAVPVPGGTANMTTGVLNGNGFQANENTASDTNGLTLPTNNVAAGTMKSCATANWHGAGTSAGTDRLSLGDLHAGTAGTYPEVCLDNALAPIPQAIPFSASDYGSIPSLRMFNWWQGTQSGGALENADQAYLLRTIAPDVDFRLRRILWNFNANSGWAASEQVYFDIVTCDLPTSGANLVVATDCTVLHSVVVQHSASPTADTDSITYEGCQTDHCLINIVFDPTDTVFLPAGSADRDAFAMVYNNADGRFTADGGTALVSYTSGVVEGWW